ncbi:bifunctional riboflavin kinase/FAD synthetase [Cellulosimicrobium marinum]|uniref:bifunctional riboflavin kinase/FAD synthetase n=1 Tax=Cellulosimicrobium marinum TaxID=1638992 RepID=UPI001E5CD2CF|nr:bifunctional riboflavin kinase/FAD synthetase [Cellulosimicrobium marinum]MCB7137712.1 bifunctional riboflavin kinase/FAD synthetase [Cellulosimicrobium marinum]
MHLWTDLSQVPPGFGPSVVTIGNFDGVHRGHAQVLGRIVDLARERDARAVAVTFHPHPSAVHRPAAAPELITGIADRTTLLAATGLDAVLLVEYTLEFARQTPEEFVRGYLVEGLRAGAVVVGHDVRFGRDNAGTMATMVELGARYGFDVVAIDDVGQHQGVPVTEGDVAGDHQARWSSTGVRALLGSGDVREAARILGRYHHVRGTVVHGDARGRDLGFPTANLGDITGMVPADGVYAGWLSRPQLASAAPGHADVRLPAAISIGTNPTFDGHERRVEAYVLDRTDLDLYDEDVVLELVERLRPTLRFDGIEPLVAQMHDDVARARSVLAPGATG